LFLKHDSAAKSIDEELDNDLMFEQEHQPEEEGEGDEQGQDDGDGEGDDEHSPRQSQSGSLRQRQQRQGTVETTEPRIADLSEDQMVGAFRFNFLNYFV
jgi:hypothetical protein